MSCFSLNDGECLAVTKCNTALKELVTAKQIEVIGGEILKITRLASFGDCFVKIYSCENKTLCLSSATYSCDYNVLKILSESFALMLISIPDRTKRLMICSSNETENFLKQLKLNDVVKVNRAVLNRGEDAVCIVKYIGVVPQIGPGTYIGFILFDEHDNITDKNHLAKQYFNCNNQNGFIRNCGCFYTRKFLLDQDTNKLLAIIKKSRPQSMIVPKSLKAKQHQSTNPSAPLNTVEPTKKWDSNSAVSALQHTAATKSTEYPRQQYIAETISNPTVPYNSNLIVGQNTIERPRVNSAPLSMVEPIKQWVVYSAVSAQQRTPVNKLADYPRQQYITETILNPRTPYNLSSTVGQNTRMEPRYDLPMCSTNSFAIRSNGLNSSEKVTIRRSIREGSKSTAKRIIIEEKVTHAYSGDKKKKKCIIM